MFVVLTALKKILYVKNSIALFLLGNSVPVTLDNPQNMLSIVLRTNYSLESSCNKKCMYVLKYLKCPAATDV